MRRSGTRRLGMDMSFALFLSMGVVLYIVLALINEPLKKLTDAPQPQGNLIIQIYWPEYSCDVDLWVMGPDRVPVGYSNKGSALFNLLRDDLGNASDLSGINEEVTISRGLPNGEYIINVHLYNKKRGVLPIPVKLVVGLKTESGYTQVFVVNGELTHHHHELTMARFLVRDKKIIRTSFNTIPRPVRGAGTGN